MITVDALSLRPTELFVRYVPAFAETHGWEHVYRTQRPAVDKGIVRRVIVENTANRDERVLVDVTETVSDLSARARLEAVTSETNVVLSPAASLLGARAVQSPKENPRAIYFQRANLAIMIVSCGRDHVNVEPWSDRIVKDLSGPEDGEYDAELMFEQEPDDSGAIRLRYSLRWTLGAWGWFTFRSPAGILERGAVDDMLLLTAHEPEASVYGWAQEPGRETYRGRYPTVGQGHR